MTYHSAEGHADAHPTAVHLLRQGYENIDIMVRGVHTLSCAGQGMARTEEYVNMCKWLG